MQPPDPVVFVFGATGYVGREVAAAAARTEGVARVVAHARPGSPAAGRLEGPDLDAVSVDRTPLDPDAMRATLERLAPTHVFLCHGTTRRRAREEGIDRPYQAIDVGLTGLVVEAAAAVTPPPRIVHLSSVGAAARARGDYLRARWDAEQLVRGSGLPHTICRAPLLGGPDRVGSRPLETAARRIGDPLLAALGAVGLTRVRDRWASMDAAEAAEGLVRSGFHYMTINRVVESDELRRVGVYERERWTPDSRRDTARH